MPRFDQVVQGGFRLYEFEPQARQLTYAKWEHATQSPWIQSLRITASLHRSVEGTISQKNNSVDLKTQNDEVNTIGLIAEIQSQLRSHWRMQSGAEYYRDDVSSTAVVLNTTTN
ncbi:MAG: hypothetical protein ACK56F_11700, partial [bacterium]